MSRAIASSRRRTPAALASRGSAITPRNTLYPDALIDGKEASLDDAIEAAADYLYNANMPLVYGLSNVTCEAQRQAVALGEMIGGVVDSHTSL